MSEPTRTLEEWQALAAQFPDRYTVRHGLVVDKQLARTNGGRGIVATFPEANPHAITRETSPQMHMIRRAKNIREKMAGAAIGAGITIPPDATDEQVIEEYGNAVRAYFAHLGKLTMGAKTLRDVPSAITRLLDLDEKSGRESGGGSGPAPNISIAELVINLLGERAPTDGNIIDAQLELVELIETDKAKDMERRHQEVDAKFQAEVRNGKT
jgi:hypothetical protein